jgi:hypothetical protein
MGRSLAVMVITEHEGTENITTTNLSLGESNDIVGHARGKVGPGWHQARRHVLYVGKESIRTGGSCVSYLNVFVSVVR